jgi:hypothetical protein
MFGRKLRVLEIHLDEGWQGFFFFAQFVHAFAGLTASL